MRKKLTALTFIKASPPADSQPCERYIQLVSQRDIQL